MEKKGRLSVIALLSMPSAVLIISLMERAMNLLPDQILGFYLTLWAILVIACPLCGLISIVYAALHRGNTILTLIGVVAGLLQIWLGRCLFIGIDRAISIPMQT